MHGFARPGLALLLTAAILTCGCATESPPPTLVAPYPRGRSVVVAPLLNQSPTRAFDALTVTDTLVAELSQVEGLTVLPTNRSLKLLRLQGQTHPASIEQAVWLARALGADGVIVGAITEYQPYKPQRVGMTLQLYWVGADMNSDGLDPVAVERLTEPADVMAYYSGVLPASQVSGIIDASRNDVTERVRQYARGHQGNDSPFGWRKYLVDSDSYMRFVCSEMVSQLMNQELSRITVPARQWKATERTE